MRCRREIGASVERLTIGGHKHGHRPTTVTSEGLSRCHVDGVDVGALLTVDLHRYEVLA